MGRTEDLPVALGDVLDGKYSVDAILGSGGMGVVYSGRHLELGRPVAIKVLRPSLSTSEEMVRRFDREARAASALMNEHVARVLDVGCSADGDPYIVMERLTGTNLHDLVARSGRLSPERVVNVALDIVAALREAHAAGIIHRDLKPANVFLVELPDGGTIAKVLDFGIAKVDRSLGEGSITTTSSMLGTPDFMAPEQLDTKRGVTVKTDVWALGVTMYYALTKETPFEAESFYDLSIKVYAHEPTPITARRSGLPAELVAVIDGCLQKDAKKRLSLDTVVEKLTPLRTDALPLPIADDTGSISRYWAPLADVTMSDMAPTVVNVPTVPAPSAPTVFAAPRASVNEKLPLAAASLGLGLFALLALIVTLVVRSRNPTPADPPPSESLAPALVVDEPVVAATPLESPPPKLNSAAPAPHVTAAKRRAATPPTPALKDSGALTHER